MSDNLVTRLRSLADCDARAGEPLGKCMREAAEYIEELEKYKSIHSKCEQASLVLEQKLVKELAQVYKWNRKLEEALRKLSTDHLYANILDKASKARAAFLENKNGND